MMETVAWLSGLPKKFSVTESAVFKLAAINNSLLEWFAFRLLRDKIFSLAVAHKFAICNHNHYKITILTYLYLDLISVLGAITKC